MLTSDHVQTSRGVKHVLAKSFHTLYVTTEGPVSARDRGRKVESCCSYRSDHMLCTCMCLEFTERKNTEAGSAGLALRRD